MQMNFLAEAFGCSGELSPNTIFLILGVIVIAMLVLLVFIVLKKSKDKKTETESKEEFQNMFSEIEKNAEFTGYFKRITNIRGIGLVALVAGLASCAVFLFAPIFQIKIELFGETVSAEGFSLWDEVVRFYKGLDPLSDTTELTVVQNLSTIFSFGDIGFSMLLLIVALIIAIILLWQFLMADKKKVINTLAHFMCDEKEKTQKKLAFNSSSSGMGLMFASDVFFIVHILLMKYLFKDIALENIMSSSTITILPLVNSVSWMWCILAIALLLVCVGICVYVDKREKELTEEIKTFLSSLPKNEQATADNT